MFIDKEVNIRGAALIQFASRYANILIQLIITAVLSRILTPEDYGIVAVTTVFTSFFTMLSDTGVGVAVVQYRDLSDDDLGALMGFSIVLGTLLTVTFCLAAWPISWFYGEERILTQCWATSGTLFLATANMVPNGILLKERRFPAIGARLLVTTILSGVVAIIAASLGLGPYSLAIQSIVQSAGVLTWNLVNSPTLYSHLTFHFMRPLRRIFRYSAFQFGFNFINYFSRNLDNLLLGRFLGTTQLAYYDKAYKLTTYPMSSISGVIGTVIQPYMSEHQDNTKRIFESWFKIDKIISLIAAFITSVFFCCSYEIIIIMFGNQWIESVELFHALSVSLYFQMINNPSGAFYQSLGRTDIMFKSSLLTTSIMFILILLGISSGSTLIFSWLITIGFVVNTLAVNYFLINKAFKESMKILIKFIPEVSTLIISSIVVYLATLNLSLNTVILLLIKLIIIILIFFISYYFTNQIKYIKGLLNH